MNFWEQGVNTSNATQVLSTDAHQVSVYRLLSSDYTLTQTPKPPFLINSDPYDIS